MQNSAGSQSAARPPRGMPSAGGLRRMSSSSLPPPPPPAMTPQQSGTGSPYATSYSQSIAKSMTIEEMRHLHQRALSEAEAKRTELRLVLASRYRELVGSSDEVIRMKERAQELHELVTNLPKLMEKLSSPTNEAQESKMTDEAADADDKVMMDLRRQLSTLPRVAHRALDENDVHKATATLIELFTLIASKTDAYPLANALSTSTTTSGPQYDMNPTLDAQMRMMFLQVESMPNKISRISSKNLLRASSYGAGIEDPLFGSQVSAAALASLDLLALEKKRDRAAYLLDTYFDSKAKLLVSLLNQLSGTELSTEDETGAKSGAGTAEDILSKIVLILQYDIVVHPFQIFICRKFSSHDEQMAASIMSSLPFFDSEVVKAKCSKFLATHLPHIRSQVKSVLVTIAGTTASALGQIRQSLYDKTDGAKLMSRLNEHGVGTWDEAVNAMVNVRTVLSVAETAAGSSQGRFSLWNALFSNTFSSLVHSILTTSFQSVHSRLVSTLRNSLANAPAMDSILPHEAYRNTLLIATDLNKALLKVSDDAHELLVHAEEREESESRLRQSLYVQTCEIMGRLVCELRRMVSGKKGDSPDATKELIVGRLCFLLKFRLTALPTLLDPKSSPASMHSTSGMISFVDLQSAFELADDNEDGLITFDEATEVMESAFSGTQFRGSEMLRETMLLSGSSDSQRNSDAPTSVTLHELALLAARGLRHHSTGPESALGTLQASFDDIIIGCFQDWADACLSQSIDDLGNYLDDFVDSAYGATEDEWKAIHAGSLPEVSTGPPSVSPSAVGFLLDVASAMSRNTCPSDSISPVPSRDYAKSLGIETANNLAIPTLVDTLRWALLGRALVASGSKFAAALEAKGDKNVEDSCAPALLQLHVDVSFFTLCFFERNRNGFGLCATKTEFVAAVTSLRSSSIQVEQLVGRAYDRASLGSLPNEVLARHSQVQTICDLLLASLLGESLSTSGPVDTSAEPIFQAPVASSRRFVLLSVQADRSLNEIQLRGKYAKEKEEEAAKRQQESASSSVVSSGLGFLSSMLKKK